jgi:L-2,4-diaminobutyrate transaminase
VLEDLRRGALFLICAAAALANLDILGFAPPLVLTEAEADLIVGITKEAIDQVAGEVLG